MPRPRRIDPYVKWKVSIEATLAARVENLVWDPIHQRPRYGERNKIIEGLLRDWLAAQGGVPSQPALSRQPPPLLEEPRGPSGTAHHSPHHPFPERK